MEKVRPNPPEKNENRIAGWMWLMVPKIEGAHAHRKLHSIDFIERGRMREEIERKCDNEKKHSFNQGMLICTALFDRG
jgi:hypothetical protein